MAKKLKRVTQVKDRATTEAQLLDAAKKVFSEHGFSAATTRMIAQKSGINLALITRYFKSKYGLLEAVVERDLRANKEVIDGRPKFETLEEECLAYVEESFGRQSADIEYMRIIIGQFVTDRKFTKRFRDKDLVGCDAGFVNRVTSHFIKIGIADSDEINRFTVQIERMISSTVLYDIIIAGESIEQALVNLKQLVSDYCRMYIRYHSR